MCLEDVQKIPGREVVEQQINNMKGIINKKRIFIFLSVLLILSTFLIVFNLKNNKKESNNEVFQRSLDVPNYFRESKLPIENNISEKDFVFPLSLPYLKKVSTQIIDLSTAKEIATRLSFTPDPLTANDIQNGTIMIWNNDKYSLIITPKINFIQYSSNSSIRESIQITKDEKLSDAKYQSIATNFLTDKIGINPQKINFSGFSYYKTTSGVENLAKTSKDQAEVIQINYTLGSLDYPILGVNPNESQIYIQILKDGTIYYCKGNIGIEYQKSLNNYPILNYNEFSESLSQSIVVSINENSVNLPDLNSGDITNIKINTISLVYLLDNIENENIQPVFLLEGTANVTNVGNSISIQMYLPAFSDSKIN